MSGKDLFWMMMPVAIIVGVVCAAESYNKYISTKEKVLKHMIDKCTDCNSGKHCHICAATIAGFVSNCEGYQVSVETTNETIIQ